MTRRMMPLLIALMCFVLGCVTPLNSRQKSEYESLSARGLLVEEKNPKLPQHWAFCPAAVPSTREKSGWASSTWRHGPIRSCEIPSAGLIPRRRSISTRPWPRWKPKATGNSDNCTDNSKTVTWTRRFT